jgi:Flp pilus assembly protein CpaB
MRKIMVSLIAVAVGVGLGVVIGWYVWPVTYTEAQPNRMGASWKDESIWMAAQAFAYDHDLEAAQVRLRPLGSDDLGTLVLDRATRAIEQNLSPMQITDLVRLAAALGARSPQTDVYLTP